jgi:hypothetical protein
MRLAFLLVLGLVPAAQATEAPHCPATLEVIETPAAVPPGFRAYQDRNPPAEAKGAPTTHGLSTIMFSDGPPEQQGWLAPDNSTKAGNDWTFAASQTELWLSCGYLATDVIISTKLPKGITSCRVTLDAAQTATGLRCR